MGGGFVESELTFFSLIGQSWYASFAFWIIGVIWFIWLFIMSIIVSQNQVDDSHRFTEDD